MKDAEATLLVIPGVTEAQVFAKMLVRCEFPMADETIIALQEAQDWMEHETGWKVEMTISAGKRPEPMARTDNEIRPNLLPLIGRATRHWSNSNVWCRPSLRHIRLDCEPRASRKRRDNDVK